MEGGLCHIWSHIKVLLKIIHNSWTNSLVYIPCAGSNKGLSHNIYGRLSRLFRLKRQLAYNMNTQYGHTIWITKYVARCASTEAWAGLRL